MLLRILKSDGLFSPVLLPVIGILLWVPAFRDLQPVTAQQMHGAMPLYEFVIGLLKDQPFWQVFLAFALVMTNAFLVDQMGFTFLFLRKRTYLSGILYLVTISAIHDLHSFVPVHLATLFILLALNLILSTYHNSAEITYTFNASFFLALASLFYLPALILLPLIWIAIFELQKSDNWRLLVIPILGFGTPWLFLWTFDLLSNHNPNLGDQIIALFKTPHNQYLWDPYFLVPSAVVTILTITGGLSILSSYHRMKVSVRKTFVIYFWMIGLIIAGSLPLTMVGVEITALSSIPVVYLISYFLSGNSRYFWREILTWIYVITLVGLHYFNH